MINNQTVIVATISKGRSVVASRFIKAETVIVVEEPLVCVPLLTSSITCLSVNNGPHRLSNVEMKFREMVNMKGYTSFNGNLCILASRFYQCGMDPRSTKSLKHGLIRNHMTKANIKGITGLYECAELVKYLLLNSLNIDVSQEVCVDIICKLSSNLFTITDDFQNEAGLGCYPYAALLNHSCEANCIQRFDDDGRIVIRTVRDVAVGEELTISYIDVGMPTWYRRRELLQSYHFHCTCARCSQHDSIDGFVCLNGGCDGLCHPVAPEGAADVYRAWLQGPTHQMPLSTPVSQLLIPLPFGDLFECERRRFSGIREWPFRCAECGQQRDDPSTLVTEANDEAMKYNEQRRLFTGRSQCCTQLELLYSAIRRYEAESALLQRLVRPHHYAVLQIRKRLKCAMEELLPVREGTLLFPSLLVREAMIENPDGSSERGGQGEAVKEVMAGQQLQRLYEDNLREVLQAMPRCYSTVVPNLSRIFYSLQLVWFTLSKPNSVHRQAAATVSAASSVTDRRNELKDTLVLILPNLAKEARVVYGEGHRFCAEIEQCCCEVEAELLRVS